jgi:hypothetical protein
MNLLTSEYRLLPKDAIANVDYRIKLYERAEGDPAFQRAMRALCADDILFWINSFVWQYNPNINGAEFGPFITWDFQDEAVAIVLSSIEERRDLFIEKSREMGASWLCLIIMLHQWQFKPRKKFLCISRTEDAVESEDPDSLFWKLDFMLEHQPEWIRPRKWKRRRRAFVNESDRSTITGAASTGAAGVGGRATAAFLDEFSRVKEDYEMLHSTADTTRCRIFNGTHMGMDTAFYELSQRGDIKKLVMHWTQHPQKNKGLYRYNVESARVELIDKTYSFPPDYDFDRTGKPSGGPNRGIRSPWYDEECQRRKNARAVSMHLDIDAKGATSQFFDAILIHYLKQMCSVPLWEGEMHFDRDSGEALGLIKVEGGPLKLWARPDHAGRVAHARYAIGCDIGTGVGTTPSCCTIANCETGEKIGEYADAFIDPKVFACMAVALCRWFVSVENIGAKLVWERQGPGVVFGQRVIEIGYSNIFYSFNEARVSREISDVPGWYPSPDSKRILLEDYRAALATRLFLNRSELALDECLAFRYGKSGHVEHGETETEDPTKGKINHGDRVIADALCYKLCKEAGLSVVRKKAVEREAPPDVRSIAGRRALWQNHRETSLTDW